MHETVGGAPTVGHVINIPQLAKACGYNYTVRVETMEELKEKFSEFQQAEGPALLEVKVGKQTENPPPLRFKPENIKHNFMRFLDF